MKLLVLSDLHLERRAFRLPEAGYDVVLLAGDIHSPGRAAVDWAIAGVPPGKSAVLVPGNHEYYDSTPDVERAAMRAAASGQDAVQLLDRGCVVVGGVRFLGCTLWTDFALHIDGPAGERPVADVDKGMDRCARVLADYRCIDINTAAGRRRLLPADTLRWHEQERQWLWQALQEPFEGPTVVVTHHAPHRASLATRFAADWASTGFINELPSDFFAVPALWVHGHTHTSFDYTIGRCRVVCNPRGYPLARGDENTAFDAARVIDLP